MQRSYDIQLPTKYALDADLVQEMALLNADLHIEILAENALRVSEAAWLFADYEGVEILFPCSIFADSNFDELYAINPKEFNFEQTGNHSIILKMGTFYTIGLITTSILVSLSIWAKSKNKGKVLPENTEYHLNKNKKANKKHSVYMADVSFISYDKASESEQKGWKERIPVAPTLSIEIVSSKYGLKPALRKMQDVWMAYGTDIGLVVCPFSEKIFIFEKDAANYRQQSISVPFTHPLLPNYVGDFSEN